MRVSKWSNSLAIRIPASIVNALELKEGEEIELHLAGERAFEIVKKSTPKALLHRLHQLRGNLPADFPFDFMQTNERTDVL
jgi:antitoxin MazE